MTETFVPDSSNHSIPAKGVNAMKNLICYVSGSGMGSVKYVSTEHSDLYPTRMIQDRKTLQYVILFEIGCHRFAIPSAYGECSASDFRNAEVFRDLDGNDDWKVVSFRKMMDR